MDPLLYHTHHKLRSEDIYFWQDIIYQYGGPILELGCGTGRVLMHFVNEGFQMVGIDNDPDMLKFIRRSVPPTYGDRVEIVEADMRNFDLARYFPLIILPCNTLSTFSSEERVSIFQSVVKHMTPQSAFVFSIPNPLLLADLEPVGDPDLEDEFTHPVLETPVQVFSSWQKTDKSISFQWRYHTESPDGSEIENMHETTHYLDPPQLYVAELKAAGLKAPAAYGDFERSPARPDSPYLIFVAKRVAPPAFQED